jgi:hypothetical protein
MGDTEECGGRESNRTGAFGCWTGREEIGGFVLGQTARAAKNPALNRIQNVIVLFHSVAKRAQRVSL